MTHKCKSENMKILIEASDVYSHNIRACDAISPRLPLLRFAALLHDIGKPLTKKKLSNTECSFHAHETVGANLARKICERLNFSNKDTEYVVGIIQNHMHFIDDNTKLKSVKRWMVNNPNYRDCLRLRIADRKANLTKVHKPLITQKLRLLIGMVRKVERDKPPMLITDLAINGHDLINYGLTPGPIFSKILNQLVDYVLEDETKNTKEILLEKVTEIIKEGDKNESSNIYKGGRG